MSWNLDQSVHNENTTQYLKSDNPDYRNWEITSIFYSAVHLVNSYFTLIHQRIPRGHRTRNRWVQNDLPQIFDDYDTLYLLSRRSRYDVLHQHLTIGEENESVRCFQSIQTFIVSELRNAGHAV